MCSCVQNFESLAWRGPYITESGPANLFLFVLQLHHRQASTSRPTDNSYSTTKYASTTAEQLFGTSWPVVAYSTSRRLHHIVITNSKRVAHFLQTAWDRSTLIVYIKDYMDNGKGDGWCRCWYFRFRFIVVIDSRRSLRCPVPTVRPRLTTAADAAAADVAIDYDERRYLSPDRRSRNCDVDGVDIAASNNASSATVASVATTTESWYPTFQQWQIMPDPWFCLFVDQTPFLDFLYRGREHWCAWLLDKRMIKVIKLFICIIYSRNHICEIRSVILIILISQLLQRKFMLNFSFYHVSYLTVISVLSAVKNTHTNTPHSAQAVKWRRTLLPILSYTTTIIN